MMDEFLRIQHGEYSEKNTPLIRDLYLRFTSGQVHLVLCNVKAVQDAICGLLCGQIQLTRGSTVLHSVHCNPQQFSEAITCLL